MIRVFDKGICAFKEKPKEKHILRAYYDEKREYVFHRCWSDEADKAIIRIFLEGRACETFTKEMFNKYFRPVMFYRQDALRKVVIAFEKARREHKCTRTPAEMADLFIEVYVEHCMQLAEQGFDSI